MTEANGIAATSGAVETDADAAMIADVATIADVEAETIADAEAETIADAEAETIADVEMVGVAATIADGGNTGVIGLMIGSGRKRCRPRKG